MVNAAANDDRETRPGTEAGGLAESEPTAETHGQIDHVHAEGATPSGDIAGPPIQQELGRLEEELNHAHDTALRAQAELENFRKRALRELEDQQKYAGLPLMRDLLPVLDNLDRAIQAARENENATGLLEGVSMVAQQLHGVLERHDCRRIEAKGAGFDPNMHEAIGQLPADDVPAGNVAEVTLDGYELHGRVVRPAQVFVSQGPAND